MTVAIIIFSFVCPVLLTYILLQYELIGFYVDINVPCYIKKIGKKEVFGLLVSISIFLILPSIPQAFTNINYTYTLTTVNKLHSANRARMRNSIKTVVTTLGVLYLCWFLALIWLLWGVATTFIRNSWFTYFAMRMILSNSDLSFPIYMKTLPHFKESFLSLFCIQRVQVPTAHSHRIQVLPAQQTPW